MPARPSYPAPVKDDPPLGTLEPARREQVTAEAFGLAGKLSRYVRDGDHGEGAGVMLGHGAPHDRWPRTRSAT